MQSATSNSIRTLQERLSALRSAGNLNDASQVAKELVEKAKEELNTSLDSIDTYASALEARGDVHLHLGKYESSCSDYEQAIEKLQNRIERFAQIGRLHSSAGTAYDMLGHEDKAVAHWVKASEYFENAKPPLLLDSAAMANNLGFTAKAAGELEEAEAYFIKALHISQSELGQEHEQTATISSNLASLYQTAGYYEKSREMHMVALETRRKLLGEDHADTAQSHNNLALALLNTGDRAWARRHFEKSLMGFEALGRDYPDDLEAVAANYCDFLNQEGENYLAEMISTRIRAVISGEPVPS